MEGNLFSKACELVDQRKAVKWQWGSLECKALLVIAMLLQALLQSLNRFPRLLEPGENFLIKENLFHFLSSFIIEDQVWVEDVSEITG